MPEFKQTQIRLYPRELESTHDSIYHTVRAVSRGIFVPLWAKDT
jgi:hypothetical protein